MIGVHIQTTDARGTVEAIRRAEAAGVSAVWLTQAGVAPDSMALLAAAAATTDRIKLGTSIIPTWPRPPVLIAQQAMAIEGLAPGRFRLGIGPGTAAGMEPLYGVKWRLPMTHLREYLTTLRALIHDGHVEFEGKFVKARARIASPADVPVMASALSLGAFRICGEFSDGAISWMCAWPYLRDAALPAMAEGAAAASRATPPLIAHVPVCLSEDPDEVRVATREQVGRYGQFPNYQAMFALAGYPDVVNGYPDDLIDNLVVSGDSETIAARLNTILAEGADEIIAHPLVLGDDRDAYQERFFRRYRGREYQGRSSEVRELVATVEAVCMSTPARRVAKLPKDEAFIGPHGFVGDRHEAEFLRSQWGRVYPSNRQWSAVSVEEVAALCADMGVPTFQPGELGENLLLSGVVLAGVPEGSVLAFSSGARLVVAGQNDPCVNAAKELSQTYGPVVGQYFVKQAWGRRGLIGSVVEPGLVRPGDAVTLLVPEAVS